MLLRVASGEMHVRKSRRAENNGSRVAGADRNIEILKAKGAVEAIVCAAMSGEDTLAPIGLSAWITEIRASVASGCIAAC